MDNQLPTADLVEAAQPNALLRRVEGLCTARDWEALVELALRCREAVERGKQLWPIAEHIDYRLALEGPAKLAASVLTPVSGRFALGPLTEVAASTRFFDELAPFIRSPQAAGVVAAERVVRGEDLSGRSDAHPEILELPMVLQPWEPAYVVPSYRSDKIVIASVELEPVSGRPEAAAGKRLSEDDLERALLELVTPWVAASNGRADAILVEGTAASAVGALGENEFAIGSITPGKAIELMGWAGASGGAHGRRRGAAAGRCASWWAAAALCDLEWPPDPAELGEGLSRLRWYRWEPMRPLGGWNLNLAVEDVSEGWAVALGAEDRSE
ncbi:MAG: hypothetical protein ACT4OM_02935 [Actinomycetota bacterium]